MHPTSFFISIFFRFKLLHGHIPQNMSNKRVLYKPVVQESHVNAGKRRTLAQGRLVTKPGVSQETWSSGGTITPDTSHESSHHNIAAAATTCPGITSSPRMALSSFMDRSNVSANNKSSDLDDGEEKGQHTPRKHQPQVSMEHSPIPLKPSRSLELSDSESDVFSPARIKSHTSHSGQALSTGFGQESSGLALGIDTSGPRVVRYVPPPVSLDLENSGDVSYHRNVPVDHIQSITVGTIPPREQESHGASLTESNLLTLAAVRDSPKQKSSPHNQSKTKQTVIVKEKVSKVSKEQVSTVGNPNSGDAKKPRTVAKKEENSKSKMNPPPVSGFAEDDIRKKVKKKKAPRVVASRYMSSSSATVDMDTTKKGSMKGGDGDASRKGPMKATDRSVLMKTTSTSTRNQINSSSVLARKLTGKTSKPVTTSKTKASFSLTPEVRGKGHSKASTPSKDTTLQPFGDVDVSAIAHHGKHMYSSVLSTPGLEASSLSSFDAHSPKLSRKLLRKNDSSDSQSSVGMKSSSHLADTTSATSTSATNTKRVIENVQQNMHLTYCRYLQWAFLEGKSKKGYSMQEKKVMSQLHGLWLETEKEAARKAELRQSLERLRHLTRVDDLLDLLEKGLEPVCESLREIEKPYHRLSEALDTRRHQIPTRGIHLPDDEDQFMLSLERLLEESEQLLSNLSHFTKPHAQSVNSFADSMRVMEETVQEEIKQLEKVQELKSATQTLLVRESSLLIQDMHVNS